jgi:hypothetical protein
MSALLLDNIVDKHAIDIEPDYLKIVKVSFTFSTDESANQLSLHF